MERGVNVIFFPVNNSGLPRGKDRDRQTREIGISSSPDHRSDRSGGESDLTVGSVGLLVRQQNVLEPLLLGLLPNLVHDGTCTEDPLSAHSHTRAHTTTSSYLRPKS